ncbi:MULTISPECIES: type VII secretion protein EccB [Nocardia]|uniref:Type VII secretion protein EccB n=3 Tax=Nocardia farcinica TaxID=37329 RepID=Q5Z1J9_NOCFA|nr:MULTISPECIES: type VII secretion protein EccB [Nocardia]AXK86381.1 type VII secretion protein EccB [Nocardia farcinica]MBF6187510.1 type VII secretion protein EccB [Nocardia farcinica]MBF6314459.1 type VII secretion protein EccB [Nocardia farcinica]MBF6361267.1 type VII secretion protein EccB [Nocardia farcinica]MBF6386722.1 type VII secretion protein EccB [Nocardia farcinica]
MPSKPTTRWQVSGYRFLVRRMEHALVRRDVRMLHDPMRSQSRAYAVGLVLGCVVLAGCGILALLRPQDKIGDNVLLIGKESGGVYVVIDGVVHPALNLASARLASGDSGKAVIVKESELGKKPRGQLIGIPGAPAALRYDKDGKGRPWSVCDVLKVDGSKDLTTSVLAGDLELGEKASVLGADQALLVKVKEQAYLVYDNSRARVDMSDRKVTDALGITGMTPRPVGEGLLNAIPEVLPIIPPKINDPGASVSYQIGGHRVGDVVQVATEPDKDYVVLQDGLQPVTKLTADIIRNTYRSSATSTHIDQTDRVSAPVAASLPVDTYPERQPSIVEVKDRPISCLSWKPIPAAADNSDGGRRAELSVITGVALPIPDNAKLVPLAQADGSGANADSVYVPPGTGAFVQTTGIEPDSSRKDSLFYVADTGVRYGIKNADAQKALGLDSESGVKPEPAPWPIVGLLAGGPTLGREEAMVAHDGVAPDPSPAKQQVGKQN